MGSSAARHGRAKELFLSCCDLEPAERATFLTRECGDEGLRAEVEAMLDFEARRPAFLAGQAKEAIEPDEEALPPAIGPFRILRKLGEGGMGAVYEAEQEHPRRVVALKVLRPGFASPRALKRFGREGDLLARLQHPGIAGIYEAGRAETGLGPQPWFAMERVLGLPLTTHARERNLSPRARLELMARVCDAVQHAHDHGVIHRDLKPGNVLVDASGQPKVLDFGVARVLEPEARLATLRTQAGEILGTLSYMSPEQASGDSDAIDARSDVYGLGVVLFELLTGRLPHDVQGKMVHEAVRILRGHEPARAGSVDPALRGDVETIVGKALEKEKERRYASAADLAADIRRFLGNEPIVARPPSALYQLRKFARRNRKLAAAALIASAAIAAAAAFSHRQWRVAADRHAAMERSEWRAGLGAMASAAAALELGNSRVASETLAKVPPAMRSSWEYRHVAARLDPCVAVVEVDSPVRAAMFSADGARVITASADGAVRHWDPDLAEPREALQLDAALTGPAALSLDRLAAAIGEGADCAALWDLSTGRRLAFLAGVDLAPEGGPAEPISAIAVSPDGARVALAGSRAILWEPGAEPALRPFHGRRLDVLAFSRDGKRLASGYRLPPKSDPRAYYLDYDGATGAHTHRARAKFDGRIHALSLSSDGSLLLAVGSDPRAWLVEGATDAVQQVFTGRTGEFTAAAFGPFDRRVALGSSDGSIRLFSPRSPDPIRVFAGRAGRIDSLAFDATGWRLLAVAGRSVQVYDLLEERPALRGHGSYVYGARFGAGGTQVVSGAWDGTLRFWDVDSRQPFSVVPTDTSRVLCLALAPEASLLATGHEAGLVRLWNPETGKPIRDLATGNRERVTALDLLRDGSLLVTRTASGVLAWDPRSGERLSQIPAAGRPHFGAVALSPDGESVAADAGERDAGIWDLRTGRELRRLDIPSPVFCLAFRPDGQVLASGSGDASVRLWDPGSGRMLRPLLGHKAAVYSLAFAPDGSRLASGADDRMILLWDPERGESVLGLPGHEDYVFSLDFSPDGSALVSGSGDNTVRIWDARLEHQRRREGALHALAVARMRPVVDSLFAASAGPAEVVAALRGRADLSALERTAALQLVVGRR